MCPTYPLANHIYFFQNQKKIIDGAHKRVLDGHFVREGGAEGAEGASGALAKPSAIVMSPQNADPKNNKIIIGDFFSSILTCQPTLSRSALREVILTK